MARYKYGEIAKKLDKNVLKHLKSTLKVYEGMDEELQGDKFIRIIVEEIKYDLAIDATRSYYDLKITGPGAGRSNPNAIKKVLNQQITKKRSL